MLIDSCRSRRLGVGEQDPTSSHPEWPLKDHEVLVQSHLQEASGKDCRKPRWGVGRCGWEPPGEKLEEGPPAPQTEGKSSLQVSPSPRFLSSHLPQLKMVATPVLVLVTSTLSTSQPE